jgi:hypothetical protein
MKSSTYINNNIKLWHSHLKRLRSEGKLNTDLEICINNLTLEELIAAKLELTMRTLSSPLFGFPLWKNMESIVQDAVLTTAMSITQSRAECARFLGLTYKEFNQVMKKHNIFIFGDPNYKRAVQAREIKIAKKREAVKQFDHEEQYELPD